MQSPPSTNRPLISIIIPTYNAEINIGGCLESIFSQSFMSYEVLVIDGNSKDRTKEIADQFAKFRQNIHCFCENDSGTYDAMNKGIRSAQGEWLLFLGADDVLHDSDVLNDISNTIRDNDVDIIYGDVVLVGDAPFAKDGSTYGGRYDRQRLIKTNICHQSIFYKRSTFDQIGFYDLAYPVCADWDFNQRCFAQLETLYTPRVISKFAAGGLSSTIKDKFYLSDRVLNAKRYFGLSYFSNWFKDDFSIFRNISRNARKNGNYLESLFFMLVAVYQGRMKLLKYLFRRRSVPRNE